MRNIILSNTIGLFDFWLAISIPFLVYKGLTIEQALVLTGIYNLLCTLFEYPTGVIGDYFGHRQSIILGNISVIVSYVILLVAQSYTVLLLGFIFRSIGISLKSGSTESLLKSNTTNYKKHYGRLSSLEDFALFCASVLSGFIAQISYELILLLSIGLTTISTFFILKVADTKKEADEEASDNIFALANEGVRFSLRNKHVLLLILLFALFFGYGRDVKAIIAVATEQFEVSVQYLGVFIGAGMLVRSAGKYIFSRFESLSIPAVMTMFISLLVGSVLAPNEWVFVSCLVLANGCMGVILSWINTQLAEAASNRVRASVLSFSNLLSRLASSLYIFAFGAVLGISSLYTAMLLTAICLAGGYLLAYPALKQVSNHDD